jgi:hypothetical protein
LLDGSVGEYTRRKERKESDEATRRQWDEADDGTRTAMVEHAKATYMGLHDA